MLVGNFLVQKKLWSEIFLGQKKFGRKFFWVKKDLSEIFLRQKKIVGNFFGSKKKFVGNFWGGVSWTPIIWSNQLLLGYGWVGFWQKSHAHPSLSKCTVTAPFTQASLTCFHVWAPWVLSYIKKKRTSVAI